jgi:4-hydroxyproline epimerase
MLRPERWRFRYRQEGRFVEEVRLTNVPGFLYAEGLTAEVEGLGEVVVDVAYGGNFYAIVEPQKAFRDMADHTAGELVGWSPKAAGGAECEV